MSRDSRNKLRKLTIPGDESSSEIILSSEVINDLFITNFNADIDSDDSSEILLTPSELEEFLGDDDGFLDPDALDLCSNSGLDGSIHEASETDNICSICLESIKEDEMAALAPCEHKYCIECIR